MSAADNFAGVAGVSGPVLMENAGRSLADAIAARFTPCPVTVLCGPGNNGGDGFVVARVLAERGFNVRVACGAEYKGDAAVMSERWGGARTPMLPNALDGAALVVDALFGAGLARPLEGGDRDIIAALREKPVPVVAIDVPSGVSGDTGKPLGDVWVHADLTVTFFRKKPAHLLLPGREFCGEIIVTDIGIPDGALDLIRPSLFENDPDLWGADYPWPRAGGYKYTRGHCVVVSGPAHATGAARLGARAALRVGAGLVSVASPQEALAVNAAQLTAIMVKPFGGASGLTELLSDRRLNTVVIGPGLGASGETRELVTAVLASAAHGAMDPGTRKIVLDADALNAFAGDPEALFNRLPPGAAVLTPHDGEFERLFPGLLGESSDKVEAARAAAARAGAVILLKGADTVVARPDGWAAINAHAPPSLATAGSGDVLSGLIGGLLAQGMPTALAAVAAVWLHGDAAGRFGPGLIAEDISEILPQCLAALGKRLSASDRNPGPSVGG
jgi:NAD(P)H-hydrate epimerase